MELKQEVRSICSFNNIHTLSGRSVGQKIHSESQRQSQRSTRLPVNYIQKITSLVRQKLEILETRKYDETVIDEL